MTHICPVCEEETIGDPVRKAETLKIKGEDMSVDARFLACTSCGAEFDDPGDDFDVVAEAYRIYRDRHKLMQPEAIRAFRHRLGLTQTELSRLLGWGDVTLTRYENGGLQEKSHNTALEMANTPDGLRKLIECNSASISAAKVEQVMRLVERDGPHPSKTAPRSRPSINSGYRSFDFARFECMVAELCGKESQWITKLNKLLFYADFLYFGHNSVSISGLSYVHLTYGPVPDQFGTLLDSLSGNFEKREEGNGQKIAMPVPMSSNVLSRSEIACLRHVRERFCGISAAEISRISHEERAYKETKPFETISYGFAETLSVSLPESFAERSE